MNVLRWFLNRLAVSATRQYDDVLQDVRYAFRQLRKAPVFTLTATLSLALGIGANAAVFTVTERVLLRPLSVSDPHELVYITDERVLTQASPRFCSTRQSRGGRCATDKDPAFTIAPCYRRPPVRNAHGGYPNY